MRGNTEIIGINKLKIGIPIPKNITLHPTPYILHLTSYTLQTLPFIPDPLPEFPVIRFFAIHQDTGPVYFSRQPGGS